MPTYYTLQIARIVYFAAALVVSFYWSTTLSHVIHVTHVTPFILTSCQEEAASGHLPFVVGDESTRVTLNLETEALYDRVGPLARQNVRQLG